MTFTKKYDNFKLDPKEAKEWLITNGYVYNEVYGWEKPETIERFGLDTNMDGVPYRLVPEYELQEHKEAVKDNVGRKTGEWEIKQLRIDKVGKFMKVISKEWLNFIEFKKQRDLEWVNRIK
jgi:hypothetical protein